MEQREIKFRAIPKLDVGNGRHQIFFTLEDLLRGKIAIGYPEHYTVDQYTGLHDKNGKEIYEGDIIKYDGQYDDGIVREVKWMKSGFGTHTEFTTNDNYLPIVASWGEVIGNIYEHGHLLKD